MEDRLKKLEELLELNRRLLSSIDRQYVGLDAVRKLDAIEQTVRGLDDEVEIKRLQ